MPRGESENPRPPISAAGVILVGRPRVTIPAEIRNCVRWLRGRKPPVDCVLSFGPDHQLVVSSSESPLARYRQRFFEMLERQPGVLETAEGQRLARFFAATWQRSIQQQFQITLPEALLKAWSPELQAVTLLGLVETLEIWNPTTWVGETARLARDVEMLLESVLGAEDD